MSSFETLSCYLFHGPSAQGKAAEAAATWGRLVGTFGDPRSGLDVETIRAAAACMVNPVIGDERGSVVLGPVDVLTQEGVIDVLLKTVEEVNPHTARPYLWAWDAGVVRPTIRSRCLMEWCPGQEHLDREVVGAAKAIVDAALSRSVSGVIEGFSELAHPAGEGSRGKGQWGDVGDEFLRAVARNLSQRSGSSHLWLWEAIRPVYLLRDTPSYEEALVRFLS